VKPYQTGFCDAIIIQSFMRPVILLVDDCEDDAFIFEKALSRLGVDASIQHAPTGQHAIEYLQGTGQYANRQAHPIPSVILLDFHLPRISGIEVLAWIRGREQFQQIPIFMLSGSTRPTDEQRARELGATRCFQKTPTCREVVQHLAEFLRGAALGSSA
jgi:CheY-like chemotaxis protein